MASRRVTRTLSDGTGRTEEELELLLTGSAVAAGLIAVLRAGVAIWDVWPSRFG